MKENDQCPTNYLLPSIEDALRQQNAALVSALRGVPDPEDEGICPAGCGRMDLIDEMTTYGKRYFFKHTKCWYAKLQAALAPYAPAEEKEKT